MEKCWPFGGWLPLPRRLTGRSSDAAPPARDYAAAGDDLLAAWSGAGDRQAFDAIVLRHGAFALRVAARLTRDPATAEDVAQEAFLRAWGAIGRFDPQRARLTTWLYRIVANLSRDTVRRARPEPLPEGFDPVDPAAGAEERIAAGQQARAMAAALTELPDRQRAALALVYEEGLSGAEAAKALGVTAKAVERLLARGREFLRKRLVDPAAKGGPP
ncbi:sigma-70 family RNA polymerase sigma factor [Desulfovibrio sp. TomC]|uniref:sigma-70 family RNA polymerase sigma factor n=1 Tax=Desulfovibrio sp. TomC TaxID=1562888 RepID=UPI0005742B64|nr:sigma-70 family RNA polymerase sigma factor [Desulfovibrio sp. TomC]KHK00897.1 RNA polymerase sigma factor RpoE [Desulfovibrio sp. TomC]